jgi:hypothetical protein
MKPYLTTGSLTIMLFAITLAACHSMRRINMENKSADTAEFVWVLKKDSVLQSKLFLSNSDTVRFLLQNHSNNKVKLSLGSGSWTPKTLQNFADDLESLQIKWANGFIKLDSLSQIIDFLSVRRKGMDNSQVKILVR